MKLSDIAEKLGANLLGDGDLEISGVAPIEKAGVGEITFHSAAGAAVSRGEGWFSSSRLSDVRDAFRRSAVYVRASSEEVAILQGTDRDKQASLVQTKLDDRDRSIA